MKNSRNSLVWIPGEGIWPVKLDPSQVDQIIVNLCVNARDAIADVGKVTIETGNVVFDEDYCAIHQGSKQGEYVMLAVSDDGTGMTFKQREKIFDPFFTTKGLGKGTGLGLSTIYGIVKQNNGFINVYSKPEKGATLGLVKEILKRFKYTVLCASNPKDAINSAREYAGGYLGYCST